MARRAIQETVDLVVVAGGDGTVRVVCAELARTDIPVAVLPAGTGNLLARNLGISLDLDIALAELLGGTEKRIDSVQVEGDQLGTDRFVVMAGLGLDAAIIADAPDELKKRVGWAAYVVSTVRNLNHPFVRVEIVVDGQAPLRRRARTVVIGNVGTLQANIPLLPDALPDDGVIDAVVLAPRRISHWPRLALSLVVKSMQEGRHIERFTGKSIQVTAARTVRRQLDGDEISEGRTHRGRRPRSTPGPRSIMAAGGPAGLGFTMPWIATIRRSVISDRIATVPSSASLIRGARCPHTWTIATRVPKLCSFANKPARTRATRPAPDAGRGSPCPLPPPVKVTWARAARTSCLVRPHARRRPRDQLVALLPHRGLSSRT